MKILRLNYGKLTEKIGEYDQEKKLMVDDYMLDEVLDKIKRIKAMKCLIDTDNKLPNNVA